jgi:hypothetical protein
LHAERVPDAAEGWNQRPNLKHTPNIMRCLTSSEIHKWLAGQGMHHQPLDCGVPVAGNFEMPAERRTRLQLADYLANLLSKDGNKLVEIIPMPQAQESDWETLNRFRTHLDEQRSLITAPGHLFKSRDRNEFRMMLSTLLGFPGGWSFYIYAAPSRTTLLFNDTIQIWSPRKKGLRNELSRYLSADLAA